MFSYTEKSEGGTGTMSSEQTRWKNKYLNLIDEHEALDKRFQDYTGQLRRALVRLSLVAEGRDPDLDSQLEAVRELLRKEHLTGLSTILDKVDKGYERWQSHQEKYKDQLAETMIGIETGNESLPKSLIAILKKARKQVRNTDKAELLLTLVNVIAQWAEAMADQIESTPEDKKSGSWFSRIFASDEAAENASGEGVQPDSGKPNYEIPTEENQENNGLSSLTMEASNVLSGLISKLTLPNPEQPRALRLLNKTKAGLSWYELVPALEILSDLVISALGTEQEEFDAFLKSLNERLNQLQVWIGQGEQLEQKFSDASKDFDEKMRGHLDGLKNVLATGNTQELKGSVSSQLDEVFATLDGFKLDQRGREIAFQQHIKALSQKIKDMDGELKHTKDQLNKSQMKAMMDSLTQLPNRGAYDMNIQKEYERFRRYGGDLSLIVCDVDKFKKINDNYGHQAGDKVLQLISRQVKKGTRDTDLIARYGGEEFVVILPETNSEQAMLVGEKIRQQVSNSPFHFKGERVQITVSCGIGVFEKGFRPEQVFDAADAALYKAKENGRNQCQLGELEGPPGDLDDPGEVADKAS